LSWDLIVALGQLGAGIATLPTFLDENARVPRFTSGLLTLSLGCITVGLFGLGAPLSGALTAAAATTWAFIFAFRRA